MYDPTRIEFLRNREDDRRRALAQAAHRRQAKEARHARDERGASLTLAGFLRRTADRLDRRVVVVPTSAPDRRPSVVLDVSESCDVVPRSRVNR